jgi:hypothetical protein
MYKLQNGRYVCKDLHTGRRQQFFMQAKLLTIVSFIEKVTGNVFDYQNRVAARAEAEYLEKSDKVEKSEKSTNVKGYIGKVNNKFNQDTTSDD